MIKTKREIEATIKILSESSVKNPFLISIMNTCEKDSHHNIGRSFTKDSWVVHRVTTSDNECITSDKKWQRMATSDNKRVVQRMKTNKSKWKKRF